MKIIKMMIRNKILMRHMVMLLLMTVGVCGAWGQPSEGLYYIANYNNNAYNAGTPASNYYLVPAANPQQNNKSDAYYSADYGTDAGDPNQPFLTTKLTSKDINSVWRIENVPGETGFYYIIHQQTGRYVIYEPVFSGDNSRRKCMHLTTTNTPGNEAKFEITVSLTGYAIRPKLVAAGSSSNCYFNVASANTNDYYSKDPTTGNATYFNGLVGLFTNPKDKNGVWCFEKATIDPPTITNNETVTNTFTIAAETGATIYYTTDGSTPTTETTTTGTTSVTFDQTGSMTVIKAIAKATSDHFPTIVTTYNIPACERPVIKVSGGTVTITCATAGAAIHYTTDGSPATASSTAYNAPFAKGDATTIRAVATKAGYIISNEAIFLPPTEVSSSSEMLDMNGNYLLTSSFTSSGSIGTSSNPFKGTIDGDWNPLTLSYPLVAYADGATIKNVILDNDDVTISANENGNAGAICCEATGDTRIYNCGVLGGSVGGSNNVGGIVGLLAGRSRVINCYNYANITSGSNCGGIVGYNNVASTSSNLQTMVMNCMFYGNITGNNAAPIYGGEIIHNKYSNANNTGLNNYCYFLYDEEKVPYVKTIANDKYHGALGAEERFLNRFEFFRMTLNSTRNMAAFYVTGDATQKDEMAKWVLDKSIAPYPILKVQDKYPSVVNPDAAHATAQEERNKGGLLGTLSVTISGVGGGAQFTAPSGASITTNNLTLNITDKDYDNFNYNYKKVQLPYYSEVGTGNYTSGRVVTGWKITSITGGTPGSFTTDTYDYPSFNYVDRKCTNKDLYGTGGSNRVFAQGAYWEVPDGVESITIEPYWAKAVYLSDANYDVTYNVTSKYGVTVGGSCPSTYNGQQVYNSVSSAMTALGSNASHSVYDYAVVLVGNYHQYANTAIVNDGKPVTFMSADLDGDNEPDNTLFYYHNQRQSVSPIRFDFLNIPGIGMVKRTHDATMDPEPGIFCPKGWFEVTNTVFIRFGQFEYAGSSSSGTSSKPEWTKTSLAPLILQGGIYEQFVSCCRTNAQNTNYLLIGGNAWFKNFANGCHTAYANKTPKVPINVAGGDYTNFYLTGIYQSGSIEDEANAECYIDGGRFTEVAGAGMQQVKGNVTWLINAADITSFYGGGINAAQAITGSISTTISNSYVDEFYGGPKFGDMSADKTVTTDATDCHFGKFFGAGFGGTAFNKVLPSPTTTYDSSSSANTRSWNSWVNAEYKRAYNADKSGISTSYDYEFIMHSDGNQTVARFYVNYASLSLATTRNVTSTLSGCTIGTFYGGGSLGAVNGDVNSTLTDCTVTGNAFGAGFSASVPTVEVWNSGAYLTPNPTYNRTANVFNNANVKTPKDNGQYVVYTWSDNDSYFSNNSPFYDVADDPSTTDINEEKHYIHTDVPLEDLGAVKGNVTLNLYGTTVGTEDATNRNMPEDDTGYVFGGGDESNVEGNTTVNIGQDTDTDETPRSIIMGGVFGGGNLGSIGKFDNLKTSKPTSCTTNTGICTVTITGYSEIGPNNMVMPDDWGHVFGASKGTIDVTKYPNCDYMSYVDSTAVTIKGYAFIKGSVYGGSENGHVLHNSGVLIQGNCQIGNGEGVNARYTADDWDYTKTQSLAECAHWEYTSPYASYDIFDIDSETGKPKPATDGHTFFGNVFGGGSGYYPYASNPDLTNEMRAAGYSDGLWNSKAGWVEGNTYVTIEGGHILTSVYGGNEMTNVGNGLTGANGTCTVIMTGGTLGVPRTLSEIAAHPVTCYLFGAGKGDPRINFNKLTNVKDVVVKIRGGHIYGSVFGGGEDGHVQKDVNMTISGGTIGTWGTSYVDGNVFGAGRGFAGDAYTAGNVAGCVNMTISGGHMLGSVYGGGRLGSVGYGLYAVDEVDNENKSHYGEMRPDDTDDDKANTTVENFKRGYVTINITGGVIGNDIEYTYDPSSTYKSGNMPSTLFDTDNRLLHTKGGNVFAGGMGRREKLDGVTPIPYDGTDPSSIDWHKLGNVKSTKITISGGWIKSNVYGGGELGAVVGNHQLYNGTTPLVDADSNPIVAGTEIIISGGTIGTVIGEGIDNTGATSPAMGSGENRYAFGSVYGGGYGTEKDIIDDSSTQANEAIPYTTDVNKLAALVSDSTNVKMTAGTVLGSVYGGGELACISGNTNVDVSGGFIGINEVRTNKYVLFGSWRMGNVYGGGRGSENAIIAGLVKGNTMVKISGSPGIYHNVYGGGAVGSVGTFTFVDNAYQTANPTSTLALGTPLAWTANTGTATVTITGTPTIGINGHDNGMVSGSSRGDVAKPVNGVDVNDMLGWVNNTFVTIGTFGSNSGPAIKGSVYGGGENGHNFGNANVTVNSGTIGVVDTNADTWATRGHVYGSGCGTDTYTGDDNKKHNNPNAGYVNGNTTIIINGGEVINDVFGGGSMGSVGGNVVINMNGGLVGYDIYGGCAKANTNILNVTAGYRTTNETIPSTTTYTTTVNLHGGTVGHNVYGGGLGQKYKAAVSAQDEVGTPGEGNYQPAVAAQDEVPAIEAFVYGDVLVKLNETPTVTNNVPDFPNNCVVKGVIHGANNYNGTPKGDVTVHVWKTQGWTDDKGTADTSDDVSHDVSAGKLNATIAKGTGVYELLAVYGGGNEAAYVPVSNTSVAHVIIDGCSLTSIETVYGGGNAASAPATYVEVNSCYEIGTVFGGGNGKDALSDGSDNPGANVGYLADGTTTYGTGVALAELHGGTIHKAFGGSNTKGNVRTSATVTLDETDPEGCPLCIEEVYGAGNEANQDGTSNINLGCLSFLSEIYGGAKNADINSDVVLTIQSGRFNRVFGGNNIGGCIRGSITVNIEETGCHPIVIGQLFGGGNQAGYSIYGYDSNGNPVDPTSSSTPLYADPQVNVKSFTSIGDVYGGGYGSSATMVGNPYVRINECVGENANIEMKSGSDVSEHTGEWIHFLADPDKPTSFVTVWQPEHKSGAIGSIGNVFGGGNAADVHGNTNVYIGTLEYVEITTNLTDVRGYYTRSGSDYTIVTGPVPAAAGTTYYQRVTSGNTETYNEVSTTEGVDVSNYYTRSGDNTQESPYVYTLVTIPPVDGTSYYKPVIGVNITGNVYGGGNAAVVTGNTNVLISTEEPTTTP